MNIAVILLVAIAATSGADNRHACREGQVWGGARCEWAELCFGSGRPPFGGHCPGDACPLGFVEQAERCIPKTNEVKCSGQTEFANHSNAMRLIVLSDGEPSKLFERYSADAQRRRMTVDYERIRIIYFVGENRQIEALGRPRTQAEKMIGISAEEVMRRRLQSSNFGRALKIGPSLRAAITGYDDMVCGGETVTLVP